MTSLPVLDLETVISRAFLHRDRSPLSVLTNLPEMMIPFWDCQCGFFQVDSLCSQMSCRPGTDMWERPSGLHTFFFLKPSPTPQAECPRSSRTPASSVAPDGLVARSSLSPLGGLDRRLVVLSPCPWSSSPLTQLFFSSRKIPAPSALPSPLFLCHSGGASPRAPSAWMPRSYHTLRARETFTPAQLGTLRSAVSLGRPRRVSPGAPARRARSRCTSG